MGKIQNAEYYDKVYKERPEYSMHYTKSEYYPLWQEVIKLIDFDERDIIEVGCGTGQFANMLYDTGYDNRYNGHDFSQVAINKCSRLDLSDTFCFLNIDASNCYGFNGLLLCLEILEHIDDITFLKKQIKGLKIIFTVPDFDDPAHVRYFNTDKDVLAHYKDVIEFKCIDKFQKYFICKGKIK